MEGLVQTIFFLIANERKMKTVLLFLTLALAAVSAQSDGEADHGKVMGCYFASWAYYRYLMNVIQFVATAHTF